MKNVCERREEKNDYFLFITHNNKNTPKQNHRTQKKKENILTNIKQLSMKLTMPKRALKRKTRNY